ncbi:MAG: RIP metalloprotease RseP [Candidatus Omnitrophota bacterium]|jgi:regulator of sigma E protease
MSVIVYILILSILIVVHEFGHFIAARKMGVKVERFSIGFGPRLYSRKGKETEFTLCVIPFGGFVKLTGENAGECQGGADEFMTKPVWRRFVVLFSGVCLNYLLGIFCLWLVFMMGYPRLLANVGTVKEGYGAQQAGIRAGDAIVGIDGKKLRFFDELQEAVYKKSGGDTVKLAVQRAGKDYVFDVRVKAEEVTDAFSQKVKIGLIGISPAEASINVRHGFFESMPLAVRKSLDATGLIYKALWRVVTGKMSFRSSMTGPLGIFDITAKAVKVGLGAVINVMAVLSISLAVFNMLPLPALDGGYIFLLLVEKIRGRGLSQRSEKVFFQAGVTLLITLTVFVFYNDLVRLGVFDKLHKLFVK